MMPVWGRVLLKMSNLVVYGPPGVKFWPPSMHNSFVLGFYFPPNHTQALAYQGDTQGSGTGKDGVFPDMGDPRGCRECSAPTLVTPEEGGLHVRSVGTGIAYQITWIGSRIIMG